MGNNKFDLSLQSTSDLIHELMSRYDACAIIGRMERNKDGDYKLTRMMGGDLYSVLGLLYYGIDVVKETIDIEEDEGME